MPNAFGVEHPISKRDQRKPSRVPDWASPMLPASTVRAYDNSHGHKAEAGAKNFASKTGGAAAAGGVGLLAATVAAKKVPGLKNGIKFGSKRLVSHGTMKGWMQSAGAGAGGAVGGAAAGSYSLKRIQENPRYRYQSN